MFLIGLLHHRKDPLTVKKSYFLARAAQELGAELLFFSPKRVNFETREIRGYVLYGDEWRKVNRPFPDVIMNVGSPAKLAISQDIVNRLKREIPFTSFPIGNKMAVYHRLEKAKLFSKYVIPSKNIYNTEDLIYFLDQYPKVVFKPIDGHQGDGVTFIEQQQGRYIMEKYKKQYAYSPDEFRRTIYETLSSKQWLAQPYINSRTREGNSFDLRLHMVKNGEGKWIVAVIYARISLSNSIVTNIHRGGKTVPIDLFLRQEFPNEDIQMKQKLESFALNLSNHLDDLQRKKGAHVFDELGIDVGIDEKNQIWLYEVNWRPGFQRSSYGKIGIERNLIAYAIYLAQKKNN
ncbi:MAG: YheC/YheD family protein [Turicibacter sp.]